MPIRIPYDNVTTTIADAISFAKNNEAHIISNSWGFWDSNPNMAPVIVNAIQDAMLNGREGKGCVVVFSAGNTADYFWGFNGFVSFPANVPGVLTVGASDRNDKQTNYSPTSDLNSLENQIIDIVAPSHQANSCTFPGVTFDVWTLDIPGDLGRNPVNFFDCDFPTFGSYMPDYGTNFDAYTAYFGGTSSTGPQAAGVAALILSINPNLTQQEVTSIIKNTARKAGNYNYQNTLGLPWGTWSKDLGYGVLNAHAAVLKAQCMLYLLDNIIVHDTIININTVWNLPVYAKGIIQITSDATLTINSTVFCEINAKFVIQPGGKLIIDGGTLTSACYERLWQGIILKGNGSQPQTPQHQGTIELINATIENAICGIMAGDIRNQGGGIIYATDAIFCNNLVAVKYLPYQNRNLGNFTKCTFVIDNNNLFAVNGKTFENHVKMNGVQDVTFSGCTFINETNNSGKGIYSIDAGFIVREECDIYVPYDCECPESNKIPSYFTGFSFGIHSNNTGNPYLINIDQSLFKDNSVSTSINNSNNYNFTRNEVNVGNTGLLSENSSGYRIEENNFILCPNFGNNFSPPIGIDMRSSGSDENYIYKNYFENLNKGISASLSNASSPFFLEGLQFICNEFRDNFNDIYVSNLINTAVRAYQVSPDESADNKFYGISSPNGSSLNIANGQPFVYYYSTNNVHVPYNPTLNVEEIRDVIANSCRSTFCTTPRAGNTDIEDYCNLQQEYDNLMNEFINGDYTKILFNLNSGEFSEDEIYNAMQLQSQLSSISNEMREISGNAIRAIIQDDVLNIELLKAWYTVIRTLTAKYALVEAHCYSSDFTLADMVLCEIPEIFEFNEFEVEEYENYKQFHNIKKNVLLSDRTWADLKEDEIAELQSVAEKQGRASTMAKGVLCFFYNICYEDDDIIEIKSGETPILRTIKEKLSENDRVIGFVVSENILKINVNDVQKIEIYDVTGRIVCTESGKNNVTIGHLPSGVYIVKIYTDDLKVESRKFIK